ncbi:MULTISPECIES: bifunctional acetate--CoA ligase family protein/GNAT family N-acetyltransferase [Deefgea]|uniref:GNAT family N-acetyltransferase n=1 Tax=Deefgea chitinilytica TaxID=570276 RepID=A0ABS2CB57_9NEIS|nr:MULTISPECIES: bifunctional acetate--CoA ligase family protein/GNAT family N-acetyltransferase [Deefgea]MBM5571383.1 GNAT family N-acetyltransferase [Deefgea chitinilytica]MBM9888616.1 bifunctional acetate--CoA ligase family protein/GNAT family N-acetyltransferase [Deefgea sp. CFH1-16]
MKAHYLAPLFDPRSIAVIGASETVGSVGCSVMQNLIEGGFTGALHAVNLRHSTVFGLPAVKTVSKITTPIDLAILTTPSKTLLKLVEACGQQGIRHIIIMSCDFVGNDKAGQKLLDKILRLAKSLNIRIMGPTVFGYCRAPSKLLAANFKGKIKSGSLAVVSQSSSVTTAILDWAELHDVGFSSVVSLGSASDIDVGDVLDYLVADPKTKAILLYIEDLKDAGLFMSALRAASRSKAVLALKVGRYDDDVKLGRTHSERLIKHDDVFDVALKRAGVLRLRSINQLFTAVRVLDGTYRTKGRRLAILTNGIGAGLMAVDRARDLHIELPKLTPETMAQLKTILPVQSSLQNPVDVLGDANAERFKLATELVLKDPNIDGVLVVFTPQVGTDDMATAEAMIALRKTSDKPLLLAWVGGKKIDASRKMLAKAQTAFFNAPESAVEVFYSLASWQYNQQLLVQTPSPLGEMEAPDLETAQMIISSVLASGREVLDEVESKAILRAFNIPVTLTIRAQSADDAVSAAMGLGLPVALKIDAKGIVHKTDIDGVMLNLTSLVQVATESSKMLARAKEQLGAENVRGLVIQPMHGKKSGRELMIGVGRDHSFGPVITFGHGGVTVEVFNDIAVSLPPLNEYLAENLIRRTRVKKMLAPFRNLPGVDMAAIKSVLLRVSEMVCEFPQIQQLDINPLVADEHGVVAVDARIVVAPIPENARRYSHMAIHPYPAHLAQITQLKNGLPMVLRPIRPEDADLIALFISKLSDESRYNRFMSTLKSLPQAMLARFTQLDYTREMAIVATVETSAGTEIIGVARFTANPDRDSCEFAVVISDQWQGLGLGGRLMGALFVAARDMGLSVIEGEVLTSNKTMLTFMKHLGFTIGKHPEDDSLKWVVKPLTELEQDSKTNVENQ